MLAVEVIRIIHIFEQTVNITFWVFWFEVHFWIYFYNRLIPFFLNLVLLLQEENSTLRTVFDFYVQQSHALAPKDFSTLCLSLFIHLFLFHQQYQLLLSAPFTRDPVSCSTRPDHASALSFHFMRHLSALLLLSIFDSKVIARCFLHILNTLFSGTICSSI